MNKIAKKFVKFNLLFVFIFLNIWDLVVSREVLNAMAIGIFLFAPAVFLWFIGNIRAIVLLTLISFFEFMIMFTFVLEGFQLGGFDTTLKSIFWVPYLLMAGFNGFYGLKLYSEAREKREAK